MSFCQRVTQSIIDINNKLCNVWNNTMKTSDIVAWLFTSRLFAVSQTQKTHEIPAFCYYWKNEVRIVRIAWGYTKRRKSEVIRGLEKVQVQEYYTYMISNHNLLITFQLLFKDLPVGKAVVPYFYTKYKNKLDNAPRARANSAKQIHASGTRIARADKQTLFHFVQKF